MKIYTVEDSRTGRSYDIPLDGDISAYSTEQLRQIMSQQDAARAADVADTVTRASQASVLPRGSAERADALQYQPVQIPSWTETLGRSFGSAASQIVPTMAQSAMGLRASIGGEGVAGYLADVLARGSTGLPIRNPLAVLGERYQGARSQTLDSVAEAMREFYDYDRTNVPEEQQAISDLVGGGVASALGYAATIPLGVAGLVSMAIGQSFDPSFQESTQKGATPGRAFAQAGISGLIEAGSEFALGVPAKIARRLGLSPSAAPIIKPIAESVDQIAKSWLGEMGISMAQEGVEEMISGLATDLSAAYLTGADPDAMHGFLQNRLEEFLGGAIGGAVLGPAARKSRQVQERIQRAQRVIDAARSILRSRAELADAQLRRQGQPPVLPQEISGISEALMPGYVEGMGGSVTSTAMAPKAPRASRRKQVAQALAPEPAQPAEQAQPIRLPNGLVLYPDDRPTGAADPGQDLPYDFLASQAGGAITLPSGITLYPDTRPTGSAPPEQDLPYDFLVQQASAARALSAKKKKAKVVSISDEDAIAAEAEAQSRQRAKTAAGSGPSIEDLEARSAEGGDQNEGQERREEKLLKPGDSGPGVVAMDITPPSETAPPPTKEELEVAVSVLKEPPAYFGLADAKTDKEYIKKFRETVKKINAIELPARREKLLGELMEEHRREKPRFAKGNKSKAMKDLEVWAAWEVSDPATTWSFLEMSVGEDLRERQQKFIQSNLDAIGDVPGPDASEEDIKAYERLARLPWWESAISTPADGAPSPWGNPVVWLNKVLATSHRSGEKRQLTNVHAVIQIGNDIRIVPVYDKGNAKLKPGQRVMIGDPDLMDSVDPKFRTKFRITADSFALKYVDKAKFIGVIKLPVGAAQERMKKTKWTPDEARKLMDGLRSAQEEVISSELYPGEDAGPVQQSTESGGGVDVSFLSEVTAREPVMAHILDFVTAFSRGGDSPPVFGTDDQIKRWAVNRFEDFVRSNDDARAMMHDIISIMMRSAVVRSGKSGTQTVAGLPLSIAAKPKYAQRWFTEQIAQAVLAEIRSQPTEISRALAKALGKPEPLSVGGKGSGERTVSQRTSEGVAGQLAARIAPAIQIPEQQLRNRGLRTSQPSDFVSATGKLRRTKSKAKQLAQIKKSSVASQQEQPPKIEGRVQADIQALRDQASGPRPQSSAAIPRTAPPIQWRKFASDSGAEYWMAPYDSEFDQWAKDNGVPRSSIAVQDFPGFGPVFRTNINPSSFSEKIDKKKWQKAESQKPKSEQTTTPKPQPALTAEEKQLQSYVDAVSREVKAGEGKLNIPRLIQLAVKGMGGTKRKRFIEGTTSAEWFDEISAIEKRHPELAPSQQEKIDILLRFLSNVDNVGKVWTLERIQNFLSSLSTGVKKKSIRLNAARFVADETEAKGFVEDFAKAFKKIGGDLLRVDDELSGPIAVEIQDDGKIVLAFNPEKLSELSWEQWSVVWDEELRHAALFAYARSKVPSDFVGSIGARVRQDLTDAWSSIDQTTRTRIEAELDAIYGKGLDDVQKTAELVRIIGQGHYITEGITKKNLGQRFLDLVRDFANWLKDVFGVNPPKPIKDLVDGSERLLKSIEGVELLSFDFGYQAADDRNKAMVQAAASDPSRESQRLTPTQVQKLQARQAMTPFGRQRLDEREAVQADMLDDPSRDLLRDIEITASNPIPPGINLFSQRTAQDEKRASAIAYSKLKHVRELADLENRLKAKSKGQMVMEGGSPSLTDNERMEVLHDAIGVMDVDERLRADLERLENLLLKNLSAEVDALNDLNNVIRTGASPDIVRARIKDQLNSFRSDVATAFELNRVTDPNAAAYSMSTNIGVAADQAAMSAALQILGAKGAADDLKFLIERLANHPQLANLSSWPYDPDQFYDQLVSSGVLADAIKNGVGLSQSKAIAAAITSPGQNLQPPLKMWGQIRDIIESLQGYKEEHRLALQELDRLSKFIDPLAKSSKTQRLSERRALYRFQSEVKKRTFELDRLTKLDRKFRRAYIVRLSTEKAISVLTSVLNSADFLNRAKAAYRFTHRRVSDVIYDIQPQENDRPGVIGIVMPPDKPNVPPQILKFELTFEQASTHQERLRLAKAQQDIEAWLAVNLNADPALRETYHHVAKRIEQFLDPDFAISKGNLNEAGLWGLVAAPFKLPGIRNFLHPVLKEIEDDTKGPAKSLISRAMAPFVRWGLFEQGTKPLAVKIKVKKRQGMESHGLVPRMRVLSKDLIDPWRSDRQDDDYRWVVIEPILRSRQNNSQRHIKVGDTLDDYAGAISPTGKVTVTQQDIDAAMAQYEYEQKIRDFTTRENFGFGEGEIDEIQIIEDSVVGQKRTRLPFAAGPAVMSRSLSVKANGDAMDRFRQIRIQMPQTAGKDAANKLDKSGMDQLRQQYLNQVLRGSTSGGVTDLPTWIDVVMSHIQDTNPEYVLRTNSKLAKVYDSIAIEMLDNPSMQIRNWSELISTIASRMQSVLGDQRPAGERAAEAEVILSSELTQGMENIRTILDNQERAATSNVSVISPKSSFTTARGHIVGPPGLYEHGLHSDFAINALHGTVLRHVTDNLLKAMEVVNQMLGRYIEKNSRSEKAGTIAERKIQSEVAYRITEAKRLQKAIADQVSVMKQFEEATRDPEQYYHDIMRWSSMFFVRPLISPVTNPLSVIRDVLLTVSVTSNRQRRSIWDTVNWWFTTPKSIQYWLQGATTMMLASFGETPSSRRSIKQAITRMVPGLASAVHSASRRVSELRRQGVIRGVSMADEVALMDVSGSLLGIQGAMEYERTRPLASKVIKFIDRFASRVPGAKQLVYAIGESRTVFEDINSMMFAAWGEADKQEVVRRAMQALATRDQTGKMVTDPLMSGFSLTEEEMGMSLGGLRQAHRWFGGGTGFDQGMLAHYQKHKGKTVAEMAAAPLPEGMETAWAMNYLTESQVQTLRERPAVAFKKGLAGRVARSFATFKTWSSNFMYSIIRGEILRNKSWKPWYSRNPEELANMIAMLLLLIALGAPTVLGIDWIKDKLGNPVGMTVENLIRHPDLQGALALTLGVAAQVVPNGTLLDSSITGLGQGSIDLFRTSVVLGGAMDIYRTLATVASTAVWNDPKSWTDALSFAMQGVIMRRIPIAGNIVGLTDLGLQRYRDASRAVKALAPSDIERSPMAAGRIPSSPAYDNVRKAMQLFQDGKIEEAQAEAEEGLRQIIASGVEPDEARKKLQAAFGAQSSFRSGFERALTDAEKLKIMERATPRQAEAILGREQAAQQLAAMFSKGRSGFAGGGGGGGMLRVRPAKRLAARRSASQRLAAMTPSKQYLQPIRIRRRSARLRGGRPRERLARLARLRRQLGVAP